MGVEEEGRALVPLSSSLYDSKQLPGRPVGGLHREQSVQPRSFLQLIQLLGEGRAVYFFRLSF